MIEDMVSDQSEGHMRPVLAPKDCGYIANEFGLLLKMTAEGASKGEKSAKRLAESLHQILQVCVYVCMYLCMYAFAETVVVYAFMHAYVLKRVHTRTHTHIHTCPGNSCSTCKRRHGDSASHEGQGSAAKRR